METILRLSGREAIRGPFGGAARRRQENLSTLLRECKKGKKYPWAGRVFREESAACAVTGAGRRVADQFTT